MHISISLKKNIIASYASQIYVTLVGIVMLPFYIKYMGAEAYGLVGFYAMLQAWFQLLDMGLTPTMTRETARFQGGGTDALTLRRLLRALEGIFVGVAVIGAIALMAGAAVVATHWLKVEKLPLIEVKHAIMLMALIVAMRWVCGLYRGVINGFERLVWLSGFNAAIATSRFVLVIPIFIYIGASPTHFFVFQLVVAIVELLVLIVQTYYLMPKVKAVSVDKFTPWNWSPLRSILKFSLSIAFTSSVWILVTQMDKLILSKLLPLADYAYFTLAVLVAGGVLVLTGPISVTILPQMTRLHTQGDDDGLKLLYRHATQLIATIAIPVSLVLAVFPEQLLLSWSGDTIISSNTAPILRLYALGNGVLALAAFPYYLQFAKGDLKLHLIGNVIFVVLLIPILIFATLRYGVIGAGAAWLGANSVYFIFWVPVVHSRFAKGLHLQWLCRDIGDIFVLSAFGIFLGYLIVNSGAGWPQERLTIASWLIFISLLSIFFGSTATHWIRAYAFKIIISKSKKPIN
jgi:O-antigen/teichoic acid export membrane protein